MSNRNDWPLPPDGFVYGCVETPEEHRELVELNRAIHDETDALMLERLIEHYPGFGLESNFYLRDLDTGEMVACLNAIPSTWSYEGIEIRNLELGFVGTREAYRKQGLFHALYKLFNIALHKGEYEISAIQGIPFFYRKYGYDFMLPLNRRVSIRPDQLPPKQKEVDYEDAYTIRLAEKRDLDCLLRLYRETVAKLLVAAERSKELWLTQEETSMYESEKFHTKVIEKGGEVCGYFRETIPKAPNGMIKKKTLTVFEAVTPNYRCTLALLHYLQEQGLRNKIQEVYLPGTTESHPSKLALSLGGKMTRGWKYQILIPCPERFLWRVRKALEERLIGTPYQRLNLDVEINTYLALYTLIFQDGKIVKIKTSPKPMIGHGGMLRAPPSKFTRLLLGANGLHELSEFDADFVIEKQYEDLIEALFPKRESYLFHYLC
ncbi:GNAT family N-acetyltransferase [Candidatus Thorarchaeota archaeon]|nr:MAG: GNAT family N-acetyltransferase [Candidatus Thorarchaeota archaeon]